MKAKPADGGVQEQKSGKKDKRQKGKQEAKVVTPERAVEINNVVAKIAASTLAAHEAAGEDSPLAEIARTDAAAQSESGSYQPSEGAALLDAVLEALPEPVQPGQSKRRSRRVIANANPENSAENAG